MLIILLIVFLQSARKYYFKNTIGTRKMPVISNLYPQQISMNAQNTVVKIKTKQTSGSGIMVHQLNNIYTVITNYHVLKHKQNYQIEIDNEVYQGTLTTVSNKDDLAVLEFTSDRHYPIAKINSQPLSQYATLYAAGYPFNSDRLQITSGQLLLHLTKPLKQGYQLGYSNAVYHGMSGGAMFNSSGEVIGINGRNANPIIADYQYQDATFPTDELQQQMKRLSWAIPISKAMELVANY